jgi:hypothetical protein
MPSMTDLLWWVQLVDSTTFEKWREMRDEVIHFLLPEDAVLGLSWSGEMPEAISIMGSGMPVDVGDLMNRWSHHITGDEYIVLFEMQRADVLSRQALTCHILTSASYVSVDGVDAARYLLESTNWGENP